VRGPTSVLASSPGPRRSRSARSHTILSSLSCTRSCTTRRLVAVQRWPVVPNAPHSAPSRARSRSASSMTSIAFLPPISSERRLCIRPHVAPMTDPVSRSEEHTSELQSLRHLVCRLLLEKKKKIRTDKYYYHTTVDTILTYTPT